MFSRAVAVVEVIPSHQVTLAESVVPEQILYYMYSKFTSYIFSLLYFREVNGNKYHYCAIFVQSLSIYTITDR